MNQDPPTVVGPMQPWEVCEETAAERVARVVIECPAAEWPFATMAPPPDGLPFTLGDLGVPVDAACAAPVLLGIPRDQGCRTLNLRLDATPALRGYRGPVRAEGELVSLGSRFALSRACILGDDGSPLGSGVGQFAIVPAEPLVPEPPQTGIGEPPVHIHDFWRVVREERRPDGVRLHTELHTHVANQFGALHGGFTTMLAEVALREVVRHASGAPDPQILDVTVTYHRPIRTGPVPVLLEGRSLRIGRMVGIAEGDIRDGTGKLLASMVGTFSIDARSHTA